MGASRSCPVAVWVFSRSEGSPKGTFKVWFGVEGRGFRV